MGMKEDNAALIEQVFPNVPSTRRKSSDVKNVLLALNDTLMCQDQATNDIAAINSSIASKAPLVHTHVINDISDATNIGKSLMGASTAAAARAILGTGTSSFTGAYADLTGIPTSFTPSAHTHVINDISNAGTVGRTILAAGSASAVRSAIFTPATAIANVATNAPVDAAMNAPTNSKTDYNVITTLLGTLVDGLNTTNTAQNTIAGIVNANAAKQNTMGGILNVLASRFNLHLDISRNSGQLAA